MAKLYFYYGTMSSSKTMNLLMVAHNYEAQGKDVLLYTSALDDRSGENVVSSRVGVKRNARPVTRESNLFEEIKEISKEKELHAVLLDEVQFFSHKNIEDLSLVADLLNIPVMAYGLKTDFQGKLFEGSKALVELADKLAEVKTVCTFCKRKATHNLRTMNKVPTYTGSLVQIGDEEYYPVCRLHHSSPPVDNNKRVIFNGEVNRD